ncbi:MAG: TetR/AcrR family transcriptional regulator [Acidimicrobiia bacterium]
MNEQPNAGATVAVYHHGDLPNALLDAVAVLVEEKGSAAVSLREVARRAGVSHSAPAHHFGDKEGMLAAFSVRGYDILSAMMRDALSASSDRDGIERLAAVGAAYVTFAIEHVAYFDVMFRSGIDKEAYEDLRDSAYATMDMLLEAVSQLISEKGLVGADLRIVAMYFWSLAHGLASLAVDGSMPPTMQELPIADYIVGVFSMSSLVLRTSVLPSGGTAEER